MVRKGRPKLETGDVVSIPISDEQSGFAQVLEFADASKHSLFLAAFDFRTDRAEAQSAWHGALDRPMILFGLTLDVLIKHNEWLVLGNAMVSDGTPWPAYKVSVGSGDKVFVEDHLRRRSRPATDVEKLSVPFRTTVAPVEFELALKAHFGLGLWDEDLETLKVANVVRASTIFDE